MSCVKYMVVAAVIATASLAAALGASRQALLADVANRTMCPIKVEINNNPDRTPQLIKYFRCDDAPNPYCAEKQLSGGCCQQQHDNFLTQCVELYDYAEVKYNTSPEPSALKVPVGCSCVIQEVTKPEKIS